MHKISPVFTISRQKWRTRPFWKVPIETTVSFGFKNTNVSLVFSSFSKLPHSCPVLFYEDLTKIDKLNRYKYINKPINKMKSWKHINHRYTLPSHNKYKFSREKKIKERRFKAFGLKSSHYHQHFIRTILSQPFFFTLAIVSSWT